MPHRPAQPRIDPRRRRPDAFDQAADDDAIGLRQPRFQRAVDFQMNVGPLRPPHHAVGKRGLENFRIVRQLDHQAALRAFAEQIIERRGQRRSLADPRRPARRHARRATARSARRDGVAPVRQNRAASRDRDFPAEPARVCSWAISRCAPSSSSSVSLARGSERCSEDVVPARSFFSSSAEAREVLRQSAASRLAAACRAAARVRAPRSAFLKAPGAAPSRHSGCFSSASSVGGSSCRAAASAASRAKIPAGVSISASPPESSKARFQRPRAAITRRASARSGVTSAADLSRCRASRIATAIASASVSELSASITARFVMPSAIFAAMSGSASRRCHCAVALEGRIASETSTSRPRGAGSPRISTSPRLMPNRCSSACIAYCG